MLENNMNIEQLKNEIQKLRLEIIEKEEKINELVAIINNESEKDELVEEE